MKRFNFEPVRDWQQLKAMRGAVATALAELPEDVRIELVIAANELVENGLLHGDPARDGDPRLTEQGAQPGERAVILELLKSEDAVELLVTTPLASEERARAVMQAVAEIDAEPDHKAAYVKRLMLLATSRGASSSKLGFHRVVLEGGCSLNAVHRNAQLTVRARRRLA